MKNKIIIAVLVFFLGSTAASCIWGSCDPVPPFFKIQGMESFNMKYNNSETNTFETIIDNEPVSWENFMIRYEFDVTYLAQNITNYGSELYALSCNDPGYMGDTIGIDTFYVKTMTYYNEMYSSGDTINEIILANIWSYNKDDFNNFKTISEYINENKEGIIADEFDIKLTQAPLLQDTFTFQLIYILNNGDVISQTSQPVVLNSGIQTNKFL